LSITSLLAEYKTFYEKAARQHYRRSGQNRALRSVCLSAPARFVTAHLISALFPGDHELRPARCANNDHRKDKLSSLAERTEVRLIFLPPYSPDPNPIETFWSWLKRHPRKILSNHSFSDVALCSVFKVNDYNSLTHPLIYLANNNSKGLLISE
jgi:hypothetical protein